jgi:LmbE family N-acetylglucosaminyl deacetylase
MEAQHAPLLIGYRPAEAEAAAAALGLRVVWVDAPPPRWLSPHHEARVGRQRMRDAETLELLRVLVPCITGE